jgi:tetratricopeptide (TPR) repeat protein
LPPQEGWLKKAESAALKAMEIDDTLPEAHASLGWVRLHDWHLTAAETELKRAVELNPVSVGPYNFYIDYLIYMGRFDETVTYIERARELDPVSVTVNSQLARVFLRAGRYDEAIDQYRKVLEIYPNFVPSHTNLAWAYAAKGMYEEAIGEVKKSIALDNSPQRWGQHAGPGRFYALSGRRDEARKVLGELKEHSKTVYIPAYNFALIYEALGDREQAFAWLEKAYGERHIALIELKRGRTFDSLRSDPKFTDLLRRIEASCR